jgi:outer membrane protein assembly factor BamD
LTDSQYIKEATALMGEEDYKEAREMYEKVKEIYPDSPLMAEARLGIADSYFNNEEYIEAIARYEEFLKYHPRNKLAPEAQFRLALSYFNQMLTHDRDQANTRKAMEEFNRLIRNYPASPLVDEAEEKINTCRNRLAEHELYVGRFYFKRKDYIAAISRFKYGLLNFPRTGAVEEATYYLAESYWQLGKRKEGREVFKLLLKHFPDGRFSQLAQGRLAADE